MEACLEWLAYHRIPAWKNNTGAFRTERGGFFRASFPGCSDILGIMPGGGRAIAVECKTGKGQLTDDQVAFKDLVVGAGGVYIEARELADLELLRELAGQTSGGGRVGMGDSYYCRYPGDYRRDTAHLSLMEHGAYNLLLDAYYSTGRPLPASIDALVRIVGAQGPAERKAVETVANEFLPIGEDGLRHQAKADRELQRRDRLVAEQRRKSALGVAARAAGGSCPVEPPGQPVGQPAGQPPGQDRVDPKTTPPAPAPAPAPHPTPPPKRPSSDVEPSDAAVELAEFMLSELRARFPKLREPSLASWARDCDRMIRLDGRSVAEARDLLRWMAGDFWGTVVLSPAKLREKWDQIAAKRAGAPVTAPCSPDQRDKYADLEEPTP